MSREFVALLDILLAGLIGALGGLGSHFDRVS